MARQYDYQTNVDLAKAADVRRQRAYLLAESLEALASVVLNNPDAIESFEHGLCDQNWFMTRKEAIPELVKALTPTARKELGGDRGLRKMFFGNYASVGGNIGCISITVTSSRDAVCERRVVGQREVTRKKPATEMVEVTEIEDIVEWECKPFLAQRCPNHPDGQLCPDCTS